MIIKNISASFRDFCETFITPIFIHLIHLCHFSGQIFRFQRKKPYVCRWKGSARRAKNQILFEFFRAAAYLMEKELWGIGVPPTLYTKPSSISHPCTPLCANIILTEKNQPTKMAVSRKFSIFALLPWERGGRHRGAWRFNPSENLENSTKPKEQRQTCLSTALAREFRQRQNSLWKGKSLNAASPVAYISRCHALAWSVYIYTYGCGLISFFLSQVFQNLRTRNVRRLTPSFRVGNREYRTAGNEVRIALF